MVLRAGVMGAGIFPKSFILLVGKYLFFGNCPGTMTPNCICYRFWAYFAIFNVILIYLLGLGLGLSWGQYSICFLTPGNIGIFP